MSSPALRTLCNNLYSMDVSSPRKSASLVLYSRYLLPAFITRLDLHCFYFIFVSPSMIICLPNPAAHTLHMPIPDVERMLFLTHTKIGRLTSRHCGLLLPVGLLGSQTHGAYSRTLRGQSFKLPAIITSGLIFSPHSAMVLSVRYFFYIICRILLISSG